MELVNLNKNFNLNIIIIFNIKADKKESIKKLIENAGLEFKTGCGFY
jgi:hypothetical protein